MFVSYVCVYMLPDISLGVSPCVCRLFLWTYYSILPLLSSVYTWMGRMYLDMGTTRMFRKNDA